jgi:hypothetical protein
METTALQNFGKRVLINFVIKYLIIIFLQY